LDSQSTVDVFSNKKLMTNICNAKRSLFLLINAGKANVTNKDDLKGYGTVGFHPEGIANILSLIHVQTRHKVTFGSTLHQGFLVHKVDGTTHLFKPSKKGLFFSDGKNNVVHVFFNIVDKNKCKYTIKEYSDAVRVHSLQYIICQPSTSDFIEYLEKNMIPNLPVTKADNKQAHDIFSTDIRSLQGKITCKKTSWIVTVTDDQPTGMLE